ncbi:SulP family inorganic anion transporter [Spirochaeta isovalerica]|uniref:SulP family sulfate permease n=1 Tax=Spirochaeta isovalerica TaxID=150 RepID=A0A841RC79_9SPIO|nr:SulP family inorganic anion transporter [Spirochaeta isovalerica]MBB6480489.1 SulP family sulfate permease [Spirochaeta isovalerica]
MKANSFFYPKFFSLIRSGLDRRQMVQDVLAGVVVGIVALPLCIAFAVASGVDPGKGLVTGILAGFIISFLGGSRVQIGGPTGAFVILIFGFVQSYGFAGLFYSTIIAGILLILFGVLKLGNLLKYIPHPLITGFTSGIALVIFSTQIKDALGLPIEKVPADFLEKWSLFIRKAGDFNPYSLVLTLASIALILILRKVTKRIPGSFVSIILLSGAAALFRLPVETVGSLYGAIPRSFHFGIPAFDPGFLPAYFQAGLAIALLGGIESLLSATVADGMISGNHRSNTELIAQGIANIVTPFFGGIPATGALARTAANVKNGGRTPLAGIVHSLTLLSIMLFFGPYAVYIPMAVLAGILIVVAYDMSELHAFKAYLKGNMYDRIILLVTFLLTVFVDLVAAIEVGIVLSSLLFMKRMSDIAEKRIDHVVDLDVIDDYSALPSRIGIYEISGPLFFASARRYIELMKELGIRKDVIIIRMRHVSFIDKTGMNTFADAVRFLHSRKIDVVLSGLNDEVLLKLKNNGMDRWIPEENICSSFKDAVARAESL